MKIKLILIILLTTLFLTSCPYETPFILGKKTTLDKDLIGVYELDSSKYFVERLIFEIDSNFNYTLNTYSEENGDQKFTGTVVSSIIEKTQVLNVKSDQLQKYNYFKYEVKPKALHLQFLPQNKFKTREPNSKVQLDSVYLNNSNKKVWAFHMKLKRKTGTIESGPKNR